MTSVRILVWHCWVAAALVVGFVATAAAQTDERVPYRIAVEGADRFAALIERNLTLSRRDDERRATRDRIERLMRNIPEEVATILAAEGYYSPRVTVRLDDQSTPLVVAITVALPKPVTSAVVLMASGSTTTTAEPVIVCGGAGSAQTGTIGPC